MNAYEKNVRFYCQALSLFPGHDNKNVTFFWAANGAHGILIESRFATRRLRSSLSRSSSGRAFAEHRKPLHISRGIPEVLQDALGLTPCCLLALRHRLATQFLNQDDRRGIPGGLQDAPWCSKVIDITRAHCEFTMKALGKLRIPWKFTWYPKHFI